MELRGMRRQSEAELNIKKVKSHINVEEAPDKFCWRITEEADTLATAARVKVSHTELQANKPPICQGAKAACMITGRICTAKMKSKIYKTLTSGLHVIFMPKI